MRELWIKINPQLSKEKKKALVKATADFCAAYIVEPASTIKGSYLKGLYLKLRAARHSLIIPTCETTSTL